MTKLQPKTPDRPGVQVLAKGSAILEALATSSGPLSVAQIADVIDEPRSTVYRLLESMHQMGWVEESSKRGRWVLGLRLMQFGRMAVEQAYQRTVAIDAMRELRDETGHTVYMWLLRGLHSVCVERMDGREVMNGGQPFGGTLPLNAGAGPMVLLAFGTPVFAARWRQSVLDRGGRAEALTPHTLTSLTDIETALRGVRKHHVAISADSNEMGITAIGAPVFDADLTCVAAISIAGYTHDLLDPARLKRNTNAVKNAARKISAQTD